MNAQKLASLAQPARETRTPLQCGENWWSIDELRRAFELRASDLVMLNVAKIGGVTGWLWAAALAHVHSAPISSHLWPELSAHLLGAAPTAHWLEYVDWWTPLLAEPLRIENGAAVIGATPGSGTRWVEAVADRFAA